MIRSEEEVVTGTTPMRPSERVRIRKVVVTENVTKKVPVRREEIRLETDPPPEGDVESVEDLPPREPSERAPYPTRHRHC
jgi:stress response protein YsnF